MAEQIYEREFSHDITTYVLARFAGMNIDPYTNFVASIMLRGFQLSIKGQRNISQALGNIPMFTATDERLAFGWGEQSMMRSRYIHAQGYEHACVIVSLAATFHEAYAAEVLHAMAVSKAGSNDMVPHIKQWRELVRAGNGSFSTYDFDLLVEDYIRLDPFCVGPGSNLRARRCRVDPRSLAKVLLVFSEVTSKKRAQLIIVGGAVIGWFAAVAEYFYDLKVMLKSCGGAHLHGPQSTDDAQLLLFYHQEPNIEILDKPIAPEILEKIDDDLAYTKHVHYLPFGGRVEWQALLPKVFGRAYHHLDHEEAHTLNTAIGAAARGFEGAAHDAAESGMPLAYRIKSIPSSHGIGLVKNITAWLPELQRGQGRMERQLKRTFQEAAATYFETIKKLQDRCRCHICSIIPDATTTTTEKSQPQDGYCLPVIVETIIALGLSVSRMIVTKNLYPSREGVQGLYDTQVQARLAAKKVDPTSNDFFQIIYGNEWDAPDPRRLQNAVQLFSGTRPEKHIPESLIGLAHEGICAYMSRLEKSDSKIDSEGLIKVVSGAIFGNLKFFNRVSAEPVLGEEEEEEMWCWEEMSFDHWSKPLYFR